jgi:3-hydroxyisobutyrate dehydrogenase
MIKAVGVIGLGNMGTGIALSLQRKGFEVRSTTRTPASRSRAASDGIVTVDNVGQVADHAQVIVLSLPAPTSVVEVIEGPCGLLSHARRGQVVIDTTTSDAPTTRRLAAALATVGVRFIDAPVSGAPELARKGQLTMMLGGAADDIQEVMTVLEAVSARRVHIGPLGTGQVVKLANNLMAAAHFLVAGEVVEFIREAGVDIDTFLQVINTSTGRSFITEQVYTKWIQRGQFNLGFTVGLMRKDLRLALEEIHRHTTELPLAALVGEQWLNSVEFVGHNEDITRIVELPIRRRRY